MELNYTVQQIIQLIPSDWTRVTLQLGRIYHRTTGICKGRSIFEEKNAQSQL